MDKCNFGRSLVYSENVFQSEWFSSAFTLDFQIWDAIFFSKHTRQVGFESMFKKKKKVIQAVEVPPKCDARQIHKSVVDLFCAFRNRNLPSAHSYVTGEFELHKHVSLLVDIRECFFQCWMRPGNLFGGLSLSLFVFFQFNCLKG